VASTKTAMVVRDAATGSVADSIARGGLAARGVIYLLVGWVALLLAFGRGRGEANQRGALRALADEPYGAVGLWVLVVGFAAYALWRISEAFLGVTGEGAGAGVRAKSACCGIAYAFLAVTTVSVLSGSRQSQGSTEQSETARVMSHVGGRWAIALLGLIVVVIGIALIVDGLRRSFVKTLRVEQMSISTRRIVVGLGLIGATARGAVFVLAGGLVIDAAVTFDPAKARGLDEALQTLRDQPYGAILLTVTALGLLIFGLYGLFEARWRNV
jgi:hypothetical protein